MSQTFPPTSSAPSPSTPGAARPAPLISFVICGRNDNYMGNYAWRITTATNCLVRNLVRLGRQNDAEIILADWNSPVPFHKDMRLVPEARHLVRFVAVPPEVAVPAQRDSKFPNPIAQNAGIRRSRGQFISFSDADVVFTSSALEVLFSILEGRVRVGSPTERAFLMASRRQVPTARTRHNPPLEEIENFIDHHGALLKRDRMFEGLGAPAGMYLMHRSLWAEAHGYNERLIYGGWADIELFLRLSQHYPWVDLANFGLETFHLEHYAGARETAPAPRRFNGYPVSRKLAANDGNWGLGQFDLPLHAPEAVLREEDVQSMQAASDQVRAAPATVPAVIGEVQHAEVGQIVAAVQRSFRPPPESLEALKLLAWYGRFHYPRTYVELGAQKSVGAVTVLAACPTCESYLVDQWSEDDSGGDPPIYQAANNLGAAQPQAQTHFITGDSATALARLFGEIHPALRVDLALLRTDPSFGDPVRNGLALAERLAPGGAIVLQGRNRDEFLRVWNALLPKFADKIQWQVRPDRAEIHLGLLFAVPLRGGGAGAS